MKPLPRTTPQSTALSGNLILHRAFVVTNTWGLHARPCALLIKTLRPFRCDVEVQADGHIADARSILSLLALAAGYGTKVTFTVTGLDAAQALAAVERLFETHFEEAYQPKSVSVAPDRRPTTQSEQAENKR